MDKGFKGPSPVFGSAGIVSIVVSGPGPPEPELGIHWDCRTSLRTLIRDPGNPSRGMGVCWLDQSF